jgi:hypothetical protein
MHGDLIKGGVFILGHIIKLKLSSPLINTNWTMRIVLYPFGRSTIIIGVLYMNVCKAIVITKITLIRDTTYP